MFNQAMAMALRVRIPGWEKKRWFFVEKQRALSMNMAIKWLPQLSLKENILFPLA